MNSLRLFAGCLCLLGGFACQSQPELGDAAFQYKTEGDRVALTAAGDYTWWRNSHPAKAYRGWATDYQREKWAPSENTLGLNLYEDPNTAAWPIVDLQLGEGVELEFTHLEYGFGWVGLHQDPEAGVQVDLNELGLSPGRDPKFSKCSLDNARVLVSLSDYKASPEHLMEVARESALSQELPEPQTWHDVVNDQKMYELLFYENSSLSLRGTTFAYLAVSLDPLCGDMRVALRSEEELAGFVNFSAE
jgi:hypothetical protein